MGGDTNNNGPSNGVVEDWGRIHFFSSADTTTSVIEHTHIYYSGNDGSSFNDFGAITLASITPRLRNLTMSNNHANAVEILAGSYASDTWIDPGVPFLLVGDYTIPFDQTLTVHAGVVVKAENDDSLIVNGTLKVLGTESAPVYFTSYRDDTVGGDTNSNGFTNPAVEDWGHILFNPDANIDDSVLQHLHVRHGGNDGASSSGDVGSVRLTTKTPTMTNLTFFDNHINAVEIAGGTWRDDRWSDPGVPYYVTHDVTVPAGANLTVDPGVVVKFEADDSIYVNGSLNVNGTADRPVVFTSFRDDRVGGDANNNGFTEGAAEDWGNLQFNSQADVTGSALRHLTIKFGGNDGASSSGDFGAIRVFSAMPVMEQLAFESNRFNAIEVGGGTRSTETWGNPQVPYMLREDAAVDLNAKLTIMPGVVTKFDYDVRLHVFGALDIAGTEAQPVTFTSLTDDSIGGDSNGNGASTGRVEDWGRIEFALQSNTAQSSINHLNIRFGGNYGGSSSGDSGVIRARAGSVSIRNSDFRDNYRGVDAYDGARPVLRGNTFANHTSFAVYNDTPESSIVDARQNYWDAANGPFHPELNPSGDGEQVSDGVDFGNWLRSADELPGEEFRVLIPMIRR